VNQPLQKPDQPELPAELPNSTVSEIASWLVGQPLDAVEREMIRHTLESCGGDRALAASVLGISLPALRKKIRAYSVRGEALPESFEQPREIPQAENDGAPETAGAAEDVVAAPEPENLTSHGASEPVVEAVPGEPEPTLAVPEPDNDPSLTLVESETVSEPAVVAQAEPEVIAPAIAPEIPAAAAEVVAEPVVEAPETPKLIAGIAAPRAKQKRNLAGPAIAGTLTLLVAAPIAYGLLTTQEKSKDIDADRNRLEVTAIEAPRFEQRIQVPVWTTPPARGGQMPVDIAADKRVPVAAPALVVAAPAPVAEIPAAAETPAAVVAAALEPAPLTVADFNTELGTEMDLGPVNIASDVAMELGPVNRFADVRMELAPADIAADTRMELGPVNMLADVRMDHIDAPEITGSIPVATFFKAPKHPPAPLARIEPSEDDAAVRPVVRRAVAPRPAQAEVPPPHEAFPLLFPFSAIFRPKDGQGAQAAPAAQGTAAPGGFPPVDCCIR
jgi:hypothetical protein